MSCYGRVVHRCDGRAGKTRAAHLDSALSARAAPDRWRGIQARVVVSVPAPACGKNNRVLLVDPPAAIAIEATIRRCGWWELGQMATNTSWTGCAIVST